MWTLIHVTKVDFLVLLISSPPCVFQILKEMGLAKTASSAVNLLIDIGYFPAHVNLDLLKLRIPTHHFEKITSAAQSLLSDSSDPDEVILFA